MTTTTTSKTTSPSRRRTFIPAWTYPRDRLSYLWLALAIVLMPFAMDYKWMIPLAAWLYPIFLLRFVRTQPVWRGILLGYLACVLVSVLLGPQGGPFPGASYYLAVWGFGALFILAFLIDRLLASRLGGLLGTLVFPLAATTVYYLNGLFDPFTATQTNPAYTQYGNLPLLQLLSVTGLWGITFLMNWLASVVNWAWERGFAWPRVRGGAALYAGLLALVLVFGGARLTLFPAQASTVRVAGISPSAALFAAKEQQINQLPSQTTQALFLGTATPAERQAFAQVLTQTSAPINDELFAQSLQEARAGAKIIVWSEGAAGVVQEDEAALLTRASAFTRTTGTYLDMGVFELLQHPVQTQSLLMPSRYVLDESILIDPSGRVVWRYEKTHPVFLGDFSVVPGNGQVPTVQTPYGRLSTVICWDADFPSTPRQAGQAGTDILLVPGNDPQADDPYHTQVTTFRAIENGYSLVRQASNSLAMTVDYEGHVLAASDYYTTDSQVMVAYVPIQGVRTIYATIGDLFAWLSMAGLLVLIGFALVRRRKAGEAGEALPISASPTSGEPSEVSPTEPWPSSKEPMEAVLSSPRPSVGEPPEASST
jgi:apolipoprotein N-acyltransferase